MNQARQITTKPQMALQSYLDGLLQEATESFELPAELETPVVEPVEQAPGDDFEAAVREEQARDAQRQIIPTPPAARPFAEPQAKVLPTVLPPAAPVVEPVVAMVETEVVADLVDQDVGDDLGQADIAALAPLVEDGTAIEEDARRLGRGTQRVPAAQINAVIEAGQFERILHAETGQDLVVGEVVNPDHNLARQRPERLGQGIEGLARQPGEVVEGGGGLVGPGGGHRARLSGWWLVASG